MNQPHATSNPGSSAAVNVTGTFTRSLLGATGVRGRRRMTLRATLLPKISPSTFFSAKPPRR